MRLYSFSFVNLGKTFMDHDREVVKQLTGFLSVKVHIHMLSNMLDEVQMCPYSVQSNLYPLMNLALT